MAWGRSVALLVVYDGDAIRILALICAGDSASGAGLGALNALLSSVMAEGRAVGSTGVTFNETGSFDRSARR